MSLNRIPPQACLQREARARPTTFYLLFSRQLISQSEFLGETDPALSKLESIAAWRIHPSSDTRLAMLAAATRPGIATLTGHAKPVESVAFSPDGKTLASGGYDGSARLWNVVTRRQIGTTSR